MTFMVILVTRICIYIATELKGNVKHKILKSYANHTIKLLYKLYRHETTSATTYYHKFWLMAYGTLSGYAIKYNYGKYLK